MRNSKLFTIAITFTLLAAILLGCAGPSPTPEPAPTPVPTPTPTQEYGVTIITHGFVPGPLKMPRWVTDMGVAILTQAGQGTLWEFDTDTDVIEDITSEEMGEDFNRSPSGEQVILVNWEGKSNNATPGFAEATGHALYSLLMGGDTEDKANSFLGTIDEKGAPSRPLHFIGHSFGTVVNSEAIQRLGALHDPPIQVEQMTTLDPHDWDEKGVPVDQGSLMPDVHVWSNVEYADNYYNTQGGSSWTPHGHPLSGTQRYPGTGAFVGYDLTELLQTSEGDPHTLVHTFYHGTIDPDSIGHKIGNDDEFVDPIWYEDGQLDVGYPYSRLGGKINQDHFSSDCRIDPGDPDTADCASAPENSSGDPDVHVDEPPNNPFFDGDFSPDIGELDARPGFRDMPRIEERPDRPGNFAAVLDYSFPGNSFETHLTYVPNTARFLVFSIRVENRGRTDGADDSLLVSINGTPVGVPIPVGTTTSDFTEMVLGIEAYSGKAVTIKFDLDGNGKVGQVVMVDEIVFSDSGGSISGHVYKADGVTPVSGAGVSVLDSSYRHVANFRCASDGSYVTYALPAGNYVLTSYQTGYAYQFYNGVYFRDQSTTISVTVGQEIGNIDFRLEPGGFISGRVYQASGTTPISGVMVIAYPTTGASQLVATTTADGSYRIPYLLPGTYRVRTQAFNYVNEYYDDVYLADQATLVTVTALNTTPNIDFSLDVQP